MKHFHIAIGALVLLCGGPALAQDATSDESIRVIKRHIDYDVGPEGKATLTVDYRLSPLKRTAIDAVGQQVLSYQEGMSELEIIEAYTLKKDGRRVDVPTDRIITQSAPGFASAPLFTDLKIKRMVFSDLEVGDQVVYRYKRHWLTPMFPGQFFDTELFPKAARFDDVRITLKQPKNYALQIQARGLTEQPPQEKDGVLLREWRYQNSAPIAEEPGAVSALDRDPVFEVSSFNSWSEIAAAYNARAKDKSAVTAEIRKTAEEITKGIKDKRQQAEAIYRWVTKNIRYVAVYLGAGGYVPHAADSILANRYGDCKDYTTLLGALLDAKGIENEPVIIEATNRFLLPEVPTPSAFNHAIVYLPDYSLYLDATARQLPFGTLSALEANKSVLHTRKFSGIVRTPELQQSTRVMSSASTLSVTDDGSIKGDSKISATGTMGVELGMLLDRLENPQAAKQIATVLLSLEGLTGTAEFTRTTGPDRSATAAYISKFSISNWINLPGPGAARLPTGLLSVNSIRMTAMQFLNSPPPKVNRLCLPGVIEESSTIQLPAGAKPTNVPKNMESANAIAAYSAKYERDGSTIKVSRRLETRFPSTICTPDQLTVYREILEQARRDTSAQMTYE